MNGKCNFSNIKDLKNCITSKVHKRNFFFVKVSPNVSSAFLLPWRIRTEHLILMSSLCKTSIMDRVPETRFLGFGRSAWLNGLYGQVIK